MLRKNTIISFPDIIKQLFEGSCIQKILLVDKLFRTKMIAKNSPFHVENE